VQFVELIGVLSFFDICVAHICVYTMGFCCCYIFTEYTILLISRQWTLPNRWHC